MNIEKAKNELKIKELELLIVQAEIKLLQEQYAQEIVSWEKYQILINEYIANEEEIATEINCLKNTTVNKTLTYSLSS
jgi:hypothetical protein